MLKVACLCINIQYNFVVLIQKFKALIEKIEITHNLI